VCLQAAEQTQGPQNINPQLYSGDDMDKDSHEIRDFSAAC
jgi:hypothetical protein